MSCPLSAHRNGSVSKAVPRTGGLGKAPLPLGPYLVQAPLVLGRCWLLGVGRAVGAGHPILRGGAVARVHALLRNMKAGVSITQLRAPHVPSPLPHHHISAPQPPEVGDAGNEHLSAQPHPAPPKGPLLASGQRRTRAAHHGVVVAVWVGIVVLLVPLVVLLLLQSRCFGLGHILWGEATTQGVPAAPGSPACPGPPGPLT